jgi:hypothetical protein
MVRLIACSALNRLYYGLLKAYLVILRVKAYLTDRSLGNFMASVVISLRSSKLSNKMAR